MPHRCVRCLQVFAREPSAGQVKQRLAAGIGSRAATAIYRRMLDDTLALATAVPAECIELWGRPMNAGSELARLAQAHGMRPRLQHGADLGTRMSYALLDALGNAASVVLIGSDCPEYSVPYLSEAFAALQRHDAVLGPAADGGYVLIGLNRHDETLFESVPWGTDQVLEITRERLEALHWSWHELPTLHDLDRPADLDRFPRLATLVDGVARASPGNAYRP